MPESIPTAARIARVGSLHFRVAALAAFVGIVATAAAVAGSRVGHEIVRRPLPAVVPSLAPSADPVRADEIVTVIPQDAKTALVGPAYLPAAEASDIQPREEVIGVVINGEARAFPRATLNVHEIVDDVIGGQPVAVTW